MTTKNDLNDLLNANFFATELLNKASENAHNQMLTELFEECELRCKEFGNVLLENSHSDEFNADVLQRAKSSAEKVWLGLVGLIVHRNGPALLGESIEALNKVKETLRGLLYDPDQKDIDDIIARDYLLFLDSAINRMSELKAATPSD